MTTWTDIASTQDDADSPLTTTLAKAWTSRPVAIAEGSTNAPVNTAAWHPYDMVDVADGADGELWSFSADGAVSTIETPDFADGWEYRLFINGLETSSTAVDIDVDLYRATDAAYSTADTVTPVTGSVAYYGMVDIIMPRMVTTIHGIRWASGFGSSGGTLGSTPTGTFGEIASSAQAIGKARLTVSLGNFDAGSVHMLRRREFYTAT